MNDVFDALIAKIRHRRAYGETLNEITKALVEQRYTPSDIYLVYCACKILEPDLCTSIA